MSEAGKRLDGVVGNSHSSRTQARFFSACDVILRQRSGTGKPSAVFVVAATRWLGMPTLQYMPPGRVTAQTLVETAKRLFYEV
ncbi:hypothetical protein TRM7557_01037 [Tritonibacter multivorans]|uniref:Uncharacterized protein n=1 Tax=Tritonibacter multivorans TaxID=928856 RepID=A0A0P1G4N4_9RHOB|nr:hypothetical protein TRM7557_01037 [Tritonibacter multivorans]